MKKPYTFVIYKDKKKEYRWTLVASNGKKVADCAEGYKNKNALLRVIDNLINLHFKIKEI